jgi:hypothetical protein
MEYVNALGALEGATTRLQDAQANWAKGAGNDVKAQLEQAGIKGDAYTKALAAIDTQMGTNYVQEKAYNDNVTAIVEAYRRGGVEALPAFTAGLATLKTSWMEQAEGVQAMRTEIINLQSSLDLLVSKSYVVGVDMTTGSSGTSSSGPAKAPKITGGPSDYGYAQGGSFIVPPGYPNDSYPMRVQSGERVTVTPANKTYNFNYTGNATQQQINQSYEMARLLG